MTTNFNGWLESDWLSTTWLEPNAINYSNCQVRMMINDRDLATNSQVQQVFYFDESNLSQAKITVLKNRNIGCQVLMLKRENYNSQVFLKLYNTNRPRILSVFASRGVTGNNWTASSTYTGDFSVLNVNNDIEEMYWRSDEGVKTNIILTCDSEVVQGIFIDTLAVLGHNLTTSATVTLQGSNNSDFSIIELHENLEVKKNNIYYVSRKAPILQLRYWRFLISDATNTNNFISIGSIVFGSANVFASESTTNQITENPTEFKDSFKTDGFTSVANSRALKNSIRVEFKDLAFDSGDYSLLVDVIEYARTTLKCLWMFDTSNQNMLHRFSVFGKLKSIPSRTHRVIGIGKYEDHISMSVEVDASE